MARLAEKVLEDSSSEEEEFPELENLLRQPFRSTTTRDVRKAEGGEEEAEKKKIVRKKRVLKQRDQNPLLLPWGKSDVSDSLDAGAVVLEEAKSGVGEKTRKEKQKKSAFEAYLDLEREEQFGGDGVIALRKDVREGVSAPLFGLRTGKAVVREERVSKLTEDVEKALKAEPSRMKKSAEKLKGNDLDFGLVEESELRQKTNPRKSMTLKEKGRLRERNLIIDVVGDEESEDDQNVKLKTFRTRKLQRKSKEATPPFFDLEAEEVEDGQESDEEDDGMSDFIVSDNEDESVLETPPPRTVRRLVQGRRPGKKEDDLENHMKNLTVDDDDPFQSGQHNGRRSEESSSDHNSRSKY
jgi:hypothetical protein